MGAIYLADDERLSGRKCAIKEVEQDPILPLRLQKEARAQFYQEASVLARLDHPNLPKVSDYFSVAGRDYLVMDFIPGNDLRSLVEEARKAGSGIPEAEALAWSAQICDALGYLHGQEPPILHRDIKPSNIRITPSGLIKLVDFGLVKVMVPDEMTITVVQGRGTALYTPLEQYGGDTGHTDVRSDIYALGCTLYHIWTGQAPTEAKQRFLNPDSLPAPRKVNPKISPETERAILWAMALHPDDRPADIRQLRESLLGSNVQMPSPISASRITKPVPSVPPVQALWPLTERVLAGAAAVLFFLAVIFSLTS